MLKKIAIGLAGLLALLLLGIGVALVVTAPEQPPAGSGSAAWLAAGPFAVGESEITLVDASRLTAANRDFPGAPERTLITTLWYPEGAEGNLPLVIHGHGLASSRNDLAYVARHLASHGYVVAAADFPLTNGAAPGGPNPADLPNQPADVSYLIDAMLALSGEAKPFAGVIDLTRIGLTGYSLGGLTVTLATFHPRWRDERVAATVSIAGPAAVFTEQFYTTAETPFLMVAGTADALVNHRANAVPVPRRVASGDLLTIYGGTHLGFAGLADPLLRFMSDPDALGCAAVLATLDDGSSDPIFSGLGGPGDGVELSEDIPGICEIRPDEVRAHPGRQQMITTVAVLSFFESVFAAERRDRLAARTQLAAHIEQDFPEAVFTD